MDDRKMIRHYLKWLRDTPHYRGESIKSGLLLEGDDASIVIPPYYLDLMNSLYEPSDSRTTGRLYEPSKKGLDLLVAEP